MKDTKIVDDFTKLNRREVWKNINAELNKTQNGRGQVLLVHLYCDYFLTHLYSHLNGIKVERIERKRFVVKQKDLFQKGIFDKTLNEDLTIVNSIRNHLGHNLNPDPNYLLETLKGHSNYWAEQVMKDLGIYGKIRFVTIETVDNTFDIFWKILIKSTLDKIEK